MQDDTALRMARFTSQQFYAASSRNLSTDGQWHQWTLSTLGRIEPPSEEPPGYYAYNEPRAWSQ